MLFKKFMNIVLFALALILIIEGATTLLSINIGVYCFLAFICVMCFGLGAGFCRYIIED